MTFSIVAREADASMFGMAIASSSPAVAARCAHARSGCGAVASQNITDPTLGRLILDAMAEGRTAAAALAGALQSTPFAAYRQLLVIGRAGPPVCHSGSHALGIAATAAGVHAAAAGNLLANEHVPTAMLDAFEAAAGTLGQRLLEGLIAGVERGGEAGPVHSAGLLIVREVSWPIVDLRVDWSAVDPVGNLAALWRLYAPQIEDYVGRARDPRNSPSFGVPGDR